MGCLKHDCLCILVPFCMIVFALFLLCCSFTWHYALSAISCVVLDGLSNIIVCVVFVLELIKCIAKFCYCCIRCAHYVCIYRIANHIMDNNAPCFGKGAEKLLHWWFACACIISLAFYSYFAVFIVQKYWFFCKLGTHVSHLS